MIGTLIRKATDAVQQLLGQSRYRVDVHECSDFLDVLRYSAVESLSQPWRYDVAVTCSSADIACDTLLLKPASFTFQTPVFDGTPALPVRTVFGVVASFRRVSTSNDDTHYALTIVPRIALNSQGRYLPAFDVLLSTYVPTIGSQKTLMIRTKRNINPAVAVLMVFTVSM